jgi:hypothetical protein
MAWFDDWRALKLVRYSTYRTALAALPVGLEAYWKHSAPQEYKGIPTNAFFFVRAAEGLMNFFDIITRSGKPCALPSEAADSVWHAWLRWNPAGLDYFCIEHFGRKIPHIERSDLGAGALLNCFVRCRGRQGATLHASALPALFRLDARLKMRGGHGYWNRMFSGRVVYARLDTYGLGRRRASPHPELTQDALQAAGLGVQRSAGVASSGDGTPFAFLDGDASGSGFDDGCSTSTGDSGCDSGSSCGSGCGGGCGGGGD